MIQAIKTRLRYLGMLAIVVIGTSWGAEEDVENPSNLVAQVRNWMKLTLDADIESAYWARGKIVDKRPFSAQFADVEVPLAAFGQIGAHAWSVSSLSQDGQGAHRTYAYNEVDYNLHYEYTWAFNEDWALWNRVALQWVTCEGYDPHVNTTDEWHISQALQNPYVTPYYLMRRAYSPWTWTYWHVGAKHTFELPWSLAFTIDFFGDMGDDDHFTSQYGVRPHGGEYSDGLMALNLVLRLDWTLTEYFKIYTFVHQFDVTSAAGRSTLKESDEPEAVRDLTIGGVGACLTF